MKSKLILTFSAVITSLFLLACSPAAAKQVSVGVSCDDFTSSPQISKEVEVTVDGVVTVSLCSNQTTGFQWSESAQISDQTVLQQTGHEFVAPEGGLVGAAGKEVWTFQALKKGESAVNMLYSQTWEGSEKGVQTFHLTVVVK